MGFEFQTFKLQTNLESLLFRNSEIEWQKVQISNSRDHSKSEQTVVNLDSFIYLKITNYTI